jgi:hypothetical protein
MDFSKWRPEILHDIEYLDFFQNYDVFSKGTLSSVASLLAATLYQGNPDRNHKLCNIVSSERYILHMQVLL